MTVSDPPKITFAAPDELADRFLKGQERKRRLIRCYSPPFHLDGYLRPRRHGRPTSGRHVLEKTVALYTGRLSRTGSIIPL